MTEEQPSGQEDYGALGTLNKVEEDSKLKSDRLWHHITVEPIVACFSVSVSLSLLVSQNLLIKKLCWPQSEPDQDQQCPDEATVQIAEAGITAWSSVIHNATPILFMVLGSYWSDKHGGLRKPLMVMPVVGQMVADVLLILNSVFWQWSPTVAALSYTLPAGLGGGRVTMAIGVICYMADITSHDSRTFRLSVVVALVFLGMPIGASLGGALNKHIGFQATFAISVAMNVMGLLSLLRVPESGDYKKVNHSGDCYDLREVLQPMYSVTRQRPGYQRSCIIMLGFSVFFIYGPFIGEFTVLYLFVRKKFGWTEESFGYYAGVKMIVLFFGTLGVVRTLSLQLRVHDALIGVLACILQMIPNLIYPFVKDGWVMYVVALAEITHGTAFTVQKSIVTKLISKAEMGQVNAFLSFLEAFVPIVMIPLYNKLYQATIYQLPGAFFLLSAALTVPAIVIFIVVYFLLHERQKVDINHSEVSFHKEDYGTETNDRYIQYGTNRNGIHIDRIQGKKISDRKTPKDSELY